jgi:hypothetical protein
MLAKEVVAREGWRYPFVEILIFGERVRESFVIAFMKKASNVSWRALRVQVLEVNEMSKADIRGRDMRMMK